MWNARPCASPTTAARKLRTPSSSSSRDICPAHFCCNCCIHLLRTGGRSSKLSPQGFSRAALVTRPGEQFLIFSSVLFRGVGLERRGQKYHRGRMGEALREEIETILEGELGDPRIGLVNVSEVQLAEDGRSARVFVVVQGDDQEAERTMQGLTAATGFIRRELMERLRLRRAPDLLFHLDRSQQYERRINELLQRTR